LNSLAAAINLGVFTSDILVFNPVLINTNRFFLYWLLKFSV